MKIAITGGTGFVGQHLIKALLEKGHHIYVLTRSPDKQTTKSEVTYLNWPMVDGQTKQLKDIDALINLAGETINQRWTNRTKQRILNSRIQTTRQLVEQIKQGNMRPHVFINASAIGYYGFSQTEQFTEKSPPATDFLARVVQAWEDEADRVINENVRLVKARFGVVLGREGGALPKMVLPYRFGIGGRVGSGEQWVSWIHIDDLVNLIIFALENNEVEGPLNCTAPEPLKMNDFGKATGKIIKKPHWIPVPSFALELLFGDMSSLLLKGQYVEPEQAKKYSFHFKYKDAKHALDHILKS